MGEVVVHLKNFTKSIQLQYIFRKNSLADMVLDVGTFKKHASASIVKFLKVNSHNQRNLRNRNQKSITNFVLQMIIQVKEEVSMMENLINLIGQHIRKVLSSTMVKVLIKNKVKWVLRFIADSIWNAQTKIVLKSTQH